MAHRQAKSSLHEFALIQELQQRFAQHMPGLIQGIGDDAAVIATSTPSWWHVTTDVVAEGIHFDMQSAGPESIGYRAAMANLSDIAAMGAVPRFLLVSLAVPKNLNQSYIYKLYEGLMNACRRHDTTLIGGDTSASKAGLFISITLIGSTTGHRALFRHGAKVGDHLYVSGTLGDSLAGLRLLADKPTARSSTKKKIILSASHRRFLIDRHLHPTARVAEGRWLNHARLASAAMDLSDGLSGDLRHLCETSRVGAEIEVDQLPISAACRAYGEACGVSPTQLALTGGEDYELLFTASPSNHHTIAQQARTHGYRITCIGTIRPRRCGIRMASDGRTQPLPDTSYEHFQ